jgi:hypothetical protein
VGALCRNLWYDPPVDDGAGNDAMAQRVNLDAMIPRADFATEDQEYTLQLFKDFPIAHMDETSSVLKLLRKPDFQRETNHWSPEQIVTFIESFLDNQLIPALILWKSPTYIFVIDGGHRLSALRAWMTDDYGDGAISLAFYGGEISDEQKRIARRTKNLVEAAIGRYTALKALVGNTAATPQQKKRTSNLVTRTLDLQWVLGNADVAETSFFNINSQGTPLDEVEAMLIRNRRKAAAIASRSILRAGSGHKYWSKFAKTKQKEIEKAAADFHELLFDPEADLAVRTIELPLGGTVAPVNALALLVDFLEITSSTQAQTRNIESDAEDGDGTDTIKMFKLSRKVGSRLAGNNPESLGLHPAVYFYNERGVHTRHLFLGMVRLITEKLRNNDPTFFKKFTRVRAKLEKYLIDNKSLITQAFANVNRDARVVRVHALLDELIKRLDRNEKISTSKLFGSIGLSGRILDVRNITTKAKVSETTKAAVAIATGLKNATKCPICGGLLYPKKSVSYDHKVRARNKGRGNIENVQMTHPYCNTGYKN